jgi:hypothetical protein
MSNYRDDEEATVSRSHRETMFEEQRPTSPPRPPSYDYGRDPRQFQQGNYDQSYGHGYSGPPPWYMRPRRQYPIETKPFFLTSEFVGAVLGILGIAITAAASDSFGAWRAWILITAVLVGYMISRGIAKSGTRSNAPDPREHFELPFGRSDRADQHDDRS